MIEKQPASLGLEVSQTPGQTESNSVAAPSPVVSSPLAPSPVVLPTLGGEPSPSPVAAPVAPFLSPPVSAAVHAVPAGVTPAEDKASEKAADALPGEADYGPVPDSFAAMELRPEVLRAVTEMGYQSPTQVQRRAFRPMLSGRDLIVQARTGSGKTAAFGLPFAQGLVDTAIPCKDGRIQALVLVPTRELALQVANEVGRLVAYRNVTLTAVYGGAPMGKQVDALRAGSHIVAGTPGRVLDHIRRGTLNLDSVRSLVLDEADEMLSMGFLEDMIEIIKRCPPTRQTLLFSATMPDDIVRISNRYLKSPLTLALSEGSVSATEIVHAYYMIPGVGRMRDLLRVLQVERPESAVIFCNTREETSAVAEFLCKNGQDAEPLSSDLTQAERERVMARSKKKALKYLVATDVAARGIDISDLSHVINYSFPESAEVYIHRTGRTGRAGKSGVAISLISPHELGNFYYTKLAYKIRPTERTLPSEAELQTLREGQIIDRLQSEFGEKRPGSEARSLVKRILASEEGERLISLIVEQYVQKQAQRSAPASEAESSAPAAEAPRRERPPQEARPSPRPEGAGDDGDRRRNLDRDSRERRDPRDRSGPAPPGRGAG
ncbi:MAG TPA: DEAD/DEAH box helicase, partial [Pseudomonadota bacterium]|nr:DEAD/DEAH box helicase [Pseudomonadota bacterium]